MLELAYYVIFTQNFTQKLSNSPAQPDRSQIFDFQTTGNKNPYDAFGFVVGIPVDQSVKSQTPKLSSVVV
jgi:hypothetical protein